MSKVNIGEVLKVKEQLDQQLVELDGITSDLEPYDRELEHIANELDLVIEHIDNYIAAKDKEEEDE